MKDAEAAKSEYMKRSWLSASSSLGDLALPMSKATSSVTPTMLSTAPLSRLPEELLLLIFLQLDSPPPSQLKIRQEPSLDLTTNAQLHVYKDISLVSQRWRRIVLPLLFRYSRVRLDIQPPDAWSLCPVCGCGRVDGKQPSEQHSSHRAGNHLATFVPTYEERCDISKASSQQENSSLQWVSRFYHCLQDYLGFIQNKNLASSIQSFVLLTGCMSVTNRGRFPHQHAKGRDHRYEAAASFWYNLYSVVHPSRIVIVAPPADMACLAGCSIDITSDWAFVDMDFHILELGLDASFAQVQLKNRSMEVVPRKFPGVADASVLKLMPWSHISLNEGSFLKAYGTYEYFERGPPSLIYSIKDCLVSNRRHSDDSSGVCDSSLRSFKYTAILPFANHVDFRGLLSDIDELDIKLAPDPGLLMDKERVGKAELEDCWQEFLSAYRFIVEPFRTFDIRSDGTPKLKKFVCRDMQIPALRSDLDDEFIALCLPVWAEPEPGVFQRLQESPPAYQLTEE